MNRCQLFGSSQSHFLASPVTRRIHTTTRILPSNGIFSSHRPTTTSTSSLFESLSLATRHTHQSPLPSKSILSRLTQRHAFLVPLKTPHLQSQSQSNTPLQFQSIRLFANKNNGNSNNSNKRNSKKDGKNAASKEKGGEKVAGEGKEDGEAQVESKEEYNSQFERLREENKQTMEELHGEEYEEMTVGEKQMAHRRATILSWRVVLGSGFIILLTTLFIQQIYYAKQQQTKQDQIQTFGDAMIGGGEWKMTDHNGKDVNQDTFVGKYQIVYFGFTFCPDVCPRELTKLAQALQLLEDRGYGDELIPIFVSVDPKRDTPALIRKFIRQFHPKIIGLTGSPQQVAKFARAYKAYYSTPGPGDNPDDYIVDHVTMMYVMGRQGEYLGHISTLENADEMADKVAKMFKDVGPSGGFFGKFLNRPKSLVTSNNPNQ